MKSIIVFVVLLASLVIVYSADTCNTRPKCNSARQRPVWVASTNSFKCVCTSFCSEQPLQCSIYQKVVVNNDEPCCTKNGCVDLTSEEIAEKCEEEILPKCPAVEKPECRTGYIAKAQLDSKKCCPVKYTCERDSGLTCPADQVPTDCLYGTHQVKYHYEWLECTKTVCNPKPDCPQMSDGSSCSFGCSVVDYDYIEDGWKKSIPCKKRICNPTPTCPSVPTPTNCPYGTIEDLYDYKQPTWRESIPCSKYICNPITPTCPNTGEPNCGYGVETVRYTYKESSWNKGISCTKKQCLPTPPCPSVPKPTGCEFGVISQTYAYKEPGWTQSLTCTKQVCNPCGVKQVCETKNYPMAELYRYWNQYNTDHFYTTDFSELGRRKDGWVLEGNAGYCSKTQIEGTIPLYRYWNLKEGDHFYTIHFSELGNGKDGYKLEGVQCYVFSNNIAGTTALHRYWIGGAPANHFYTTNFNEINSGKKLGYKYEGIMGYVSTKSTLSTTQCKQVNTCA